MRVLPFIAVALMLLFPMRGTATTYATTCKQARTPVNDVFFLDSGHGWIVTGGDNKQPHILKTANGGSSWTSTRLPLVLYKIFFVDEDLGWGLGIVPGEDDEFSVELLRTSDGGENWTSVSILTKSPGHLVLDLFFIDANNGWFVGQLEGGEGFFLHTLDGGYTVQKPSGLPEWIPSAIRIHYNEHLGLWIFGNNFIAHTADQGTSWQIQLNREHLPDGLIDAVVFDGVVGSSGRGCAVGSGATILTTEDSGRTWSVALRSRESTYLRALSFWDDDHGCTVGFNNYMYCTGDGGKTWETRRTLPELIEAGKKWYSYERIFMFSSGRGWVVGCGGYLFETQSAGKTWDEVDLVKLITAARGK